jgi:uncharacterized surface protein with fasciclin (FAS1) repeats
LDLRPPANIHHPRASVEIGEEMPMKLKLFALGFIAIAGVALAAQEKTVMVGGESMFPSKNIVANAVNSKDHTTLVAAVKAAGLVETLQGAGPFTVFAPTNAAFAKLPAGTVDSLLRPDMKSTLTKVLTYHVVPGRLTADSLWKLVRDGKGTATLTTVAGGKLWVTMNGAKNLVLKDEKGAWVEISTYDVMQSNGVIHVITGVLMPS